MFSFGQHLRLKEHIFDHTKNFNTSHFGNKGKGIELNALEALEIHIKKKKPKLLNDQIDTKF